MTLLLLFNAPAAPPSTAIGTAFYSFVEAGMFLGQWEIDDYLTFTACIHSSTGAAANADADPTYAIYEDETAAAILSGTMTQIGAVTGFYSERVQLTAANGLEVGKTYAIRVSAIVAGVTAAAAHLFQVVDTEATLDGIKAKTDLLTSATSVTIASPVSGANVTTIQGDDYDTADGRQLSWTVSTSATLTGGTVVVILSGVATYTGAITAETTVTLDLTATQTAAIPVGRYKYQVVATQAAGSGSDVITLVEGTWTSAARVSS